MEKAHDAYGHEVLYALLTSLVHFLQIRLTDAQQQKSAQDTKPEQVEKWTKLEGWRKELKLLEIKKAEMATS